MEKNQSPQQKVKLPPPPPPPPLPSLYEVQFVFPAFPTLTNIRPCVSKTIFPPETIYPRLAGGSLIPASFTADIFVNDPEPLCCKTLIAFFFFSERRFMDEELGQTLKSRKWFVPYKQWRTRTKQFSLWGPSVCSAAWVNIIFSVSNITAFFQFVILSIHHAFPSLLFDLWNCRICVCGGGRNMTKYWRSGDKTG